MLAGISAAIAAIPEEPPILLAVILGLGAYRLLRRGVLVRRLNAEETLGAVDLIVTDKTGTLTENRLAVARRRDAWTARSSDPRRAAALLERGPARRGGRLARRGRGSARLVHAGAARGAPRPGGAAARPRRPRRRREAAERRPAVVARRGARRTASMEELALGAPEAVLALPRATGGRSSLRWHALVEREAGRRAAVCCSLRRSADATRGGRWR